MKLFINTWIQERLISGYETENYSLINKIALNLLKNEESVKVGVKAKQLKAGRDQANMMNAHTVDLTSV